MNTKFLEIGFPKIVCVCVCVCVRACVLLRQFKITGVMWLDINSVWLDKPFYLVYMTVVFGGKLISWL